MSTHLEKELDQLKAILDHQFGFRRKRSTIDAIQAVTQFAANAIEEERWLGGSKKYCLVCNLDVKNAFNSANWNFVLQALHRMGILALPDRPRRGLLQGQSAHIFL